MGGDKEDDICNFTCLICKAITYQAKSIWEAVIFSDELVIISNMLSYLQILVACSYSDHICSTCLLELHQAYCFKKKCDLLNSNDVDSSINYNYYNIDNEEQNNNNNVSLAIPHTTYAKVKCSEDIDKDYIFCKFMQDTANNLKNKTNAMSSLANESTEKNFMNCDLQCSNLCGVKDEPGPSQLVNCCESIYKILNEDPFLFNNNYNEIQDIWNFNNSLNNNTEVINEKNVDILNHQLGNEQDNESIESVHDNELHQIWNDNHLNNDMQNIQNYDNFKFNSYNNVDNEMESFFNIGNENIFNSNIFNENIDVCSDIDGKFDISITCKHFNNGIEPTLNLKHENKFNTDFHGKTQCNADHKFNNCVNNSDSSSMQSSLNFYVSNIDVSKKIKFIDNYSENNHTKIESKFLLHLNNNNAISNNNGDMLNCNSYNFNNNILQPINPNLVKGKTVCEISIINKSNIFNKEISHTVTSDNTNCNMKLSTDISNNFFNNYNNENHSVINFNNNNTKHRVSQKVLNTLKKSKKIPPRFPCKHCNKRYDTKQNLKLHEPKHINKCYICHKNFLFEYTLASHMKTHTQNKICCNICDLYITSVKKLLNHSHAHYGRFDVVCLKCNDKFTNITSVLQHLNSLHDKIPSPKLRCHKCKKKFMTNACLRKHMYSHNKQFLCEYCSTLFHTIDDLNQHIIIHI